MRTAAILSLLVPACASAQVSLSFAAVSDGASPAGGAAFVVIGESFTGESSRAGVTLTLGITPCLFTDDAPPCPADMNRDGGIDGGDLETFFNAWHAGLPEADVNADGGTDGADVEAFILLWEAGGC